MSKPVMVEIQFQDENGHFYVGELVNPFRIADGAIQVHNVHIHEDGRETINVAVLDEDYNIHVFNPPLFQVASTRLLAVSQ